MVLLTTAPAARACFVYITLPGQITTVTAGSYRLLTSATGEAEGEFRYERHYVERRDAVEIDPVELVLDPDKIFLTTRHGGLFGSLRDACPDAWGRRLIEGRLGKGPAESSPIDYMLDAPDDRAGALTFGSSVEPPAPARRFNTVHGLRRLMDRADRIAAADADPFQVITVEEGQADAGLPEGLIHEGTSLGGARPKVTVEDQGALWIAKLPQPGDRWNNPRVEHGMVQLARACGISAVQTRIVTVDGRDVLLVRRFDRERVENGYARIRMVSGLTMLGLDEDERGEWSYLRLAEALRRCAPGNQMEPHELFRRMVFNALISNTDDHPRNHAFLAHGTSWALSPAYDLTPTPSISENRYLAMACGHGGRVATRENLLSACECFQLAREDAERIIDGMRLAVDTGWYAAVRGAGVTEADAEAIHRAFVCPGFGAHPLTTRLDG